MSNNKSGCTINVGVCSLLGVAFVVLKLCGVINWSWLWVTAPFWGPIALLLIILFLMAMLSLTVITIESLANNRKR